MVTQVVNVYRRVKLTNLALNKTATASSSWDATYVPSNANDGKIVNTYPDGWAPKASPASRIGEPTSQEDEPSWWQVDLGASYQIARIELVTRQLEDYPLSRYNFEIRASNHEGMDEYAVLGRQGCSNAIPFKGTWVTDVTDPNSYRYIRAAKIAKDYCGWWEFFIAELRVLGYTQ